MFTSNDVLAADLKDLPVWRAIGEALRADNAREVARWVVRFAVGCGLLSPKGGSGTVRVTMPRCGRMEEEVFSVEIDPREFSPDPAMIATLEKQTGKKVAAMAMPDLIIEVAEGLVTARAIERG